MMQAWDEKALGELCTLRAGSAFKTHYQGKTSGKFPFIKVSDMNLPENEICIREANNWVEEDVRVEIKAKPLPPGTTVFAKIGEALKQNRVRYLVRDTIVDNNMMGAVPDLKKVDPRFFFYCLSNFDIAGTATGTALPYLTVSTLSESRFSVPPLPVQRRIGGILSAYDELIENTQRRIRILEDMARSLYREWFVHFRYPGHESVSLVDSPLGRIPQGWEARYVKDIANVIYGCALKSKNFNTEGNGLPVVRIRDIPTGASETYTDEVCDSKYQIKNGHILVGMDGDFHMCIWSNGLALQNQRVAKFESQGEIGNYHLYLALEKPIQEFNKAIVGTTVAHLGDMHIKTIQIAWPPAKLREKAREILEPMSVRIIALKRQTANLRRTRDLLMPRLLSGKINFPGE